MMRWFHLKPIAGSCNSIDTIDDVDSIDVSAKRNKLQLVLLSIFMINAPAPANSTDLVYGIHVHAS